MRGAVALQQVRLENSKNTLESNLEILRRKEAQRRSIEVRIHQIMISGFKFICYFFCPKGIKWIN